MKLTKIAVVAMGLLSSAAFAQSSAVNLKTQTGNEIGATLSSYSYSEPSLSVSMKATNWGIDYTGTYAFGNDWFVLGNANYNNGPVTYSGTGTQSGIPQYYYDFKGVVGYDFAFDGYNLSPYAGFGYRFLSQQWGGTSTSTGALGYDRQSTYNYLPIGLIHRFAVNNNQAKIETTLEYDYLLSGNQYSGLASLNGTHSGTTYSGIPNVNNSQNSGYGLNLTVMYKEESWGVGPYFKYWNIQQSNTNYATITKNGSAVNYYEYEPANNTKEYGIKAIYRF
ncbi:hypothetical protein AOC06_03660 [Polynucleobacter paludilacus]|uniref:hypothetical protein n=1 Tax=Polynucleobacter paludilacus TaxID=1855895 RepID=UPI001BFE2252|nr:hypothetical protein [Polynucleobacter paludilacus]QWD87673.1 hypothetical protein AOC06_03660 [Polynucleobacter paludilacus]